MQLLSQIFHKLPLLPVELSLLATCCYAQAQAQAAPNPVPAPGSLPRLPPTEAADALSTFQVREGFLVEQVAAEPLVSDPVAIAFDESGRLFVAEMRGYSERREDALGRIRVLDDTDADGHYDVSSVFADGLRWPTGVICWKGGVFVIASPDILYCADADGDGYAESTKVVFTGFGSGRERLNVQALPNSLVWGPDNRIHGATAMNGGQVHRPGEKNFVNLDGRDFSFDPVSLDLRAENGGGQYGMAFDSCGRKFVCSNSNHIQWIAYGAMFNTAKLPHPRTDIAIDGPSAEVFRTSPDEPWRIVRTRWRVEGQVAGPVEGGGRPSGYFTAATGITLYRGNAFPPEFADNAFVCDAGSNLVHRKIVEPSAGNHLHKARRPDDEQDTEFLTSSDNWFRPVQATNGPDGALYVVDMYREVIEHPWSLPETIKSKLDLNSGNDRGRIYRIVPDSFRQPAPTVFDRTKGSELVKALNSPNGWVRDTASRLLIEEEQEDTVIELRKLAESANSFTARQTAIQLLASLGALDTGIVARAARDLSPGVRRQAITLAMNHQESEIQRAILPLASDADAEVSFQAALALSIVPTSPQIREALVTVVETHPKQRWCRLAALVGLIKEPLDALSAVLESERIVAHPDAFDVLEGLLEAAPKPLPAPVSDHLKQLLKQISDPVGRGALVNISGIALSKSETIALTSAIQSIVLERNAGTDARIAAIRQLARLQGPDCLKTLANVISPAEAPALQEASLATIGDTGMDDGGKAILQQWKQLTPSLHRLALAQLFRNPAWRSDLLTGLESDAIPISLLQPQQIETLRNSGSPSNKAKARRLLVSSIQMTKKDVIEHYAPSLELKGEPTNGGTIFSARCASCHRKGQLGYRFGPDVATFQRAGASSILTNIIEPDREIQPRYSAVSIKTQSGALHTGYLIDESAESVTLREIVTGDRTINRNAISTMETQANSAMPQGLEAGLSQQEMADLLAFIVSQ